MCLLVMNNIEFAGLVGQDQDLKNRIVLLFGTSFENFAPF